MRLLNWGSLFETKIADIDEQHKRLFDLINIVHEAVQNKKGLEVMNKAITELISYTNYHFTNEENYMKKFKYPEYEKHKLEHEALFKKVLDFQERYTDTPNDLMLSQELSIFLKKWLTDHIIGVDKKYAPFLISKGVK